MALIVMIMNVTPRDADALRLLARFKFITIEQAQWCVYGNHNVAQRRLQFLEHDGWLGSIPLSDDRRGKPVKLYYVACSRKNDLAKIIGLDDASGTIIQRLPENLVRLRHAVEVNQVIAVFFSACKIRGLSFSFFTEHETPTNRVSPNPLLLDEVDDPDCPGRRVSFQRDAVCCISSDQAHALFEIELDLGKEAIVTSSHRRITLSNKIRLFIQSVKQRRFLRYSTPAFFDHPFQVSRLLLITTSDQRVSNLASFCHQHNTHGLVYLATLAEITPETIFEPIWRVPDNGSLNRKKLGK